MAPFIMYAWQQTYFKSDNIDVQFVGLLFSISFKGLILPYFTMISKYISQTTNVFMINRWKKYLKEKF